MTYFLHHHIKNCLRLPYKTDQHLVFPEQKRGGTNFSRVLCQRIGLQPKPKPARHQPSMKHWMGWSPNIGCFHSESVTTRSLSFFYLFSSFFISPKCLLIISNNNICQSVNLEKLTIYALIVPLDHQFFLFPISSSFLFFICHLFLGCPN